ncbi:TonB-dependent receptor domain-containing protein [Erythrobacter sp. EC-HK427]|uniref:TonB-dependent receptor domain-containing protein n=1 Tax=Erythrobacter sp. EC-HK427 TaxID=2038396 RepID=UPI0012593915|nr:TonB-dependent receptor [Erythrobacter sp. EC-HK427]VVS97991.1 TonB-dependent receptor [Erythrobacter sp. EC-HK427]
MKKFQKNALSGLALSVSAVALLAGGSAFAQEVDPEDEEEVSVADPETAAPEQRIVVTGSRIRTDTYNSISPLQVLDSEAARDVGEFDAAEILQRSEAAAGTQIDATFQGFVLNNGPGSQTLDLRGLGADRTLLMINGRRLAPAGVEGAPTNPSINLLPTSLIQRYDLLLDGASSVYGSDAVAGVGNIVLRTDIDGFEFFASGNKNEQSNGGDDYTISGAWGTTFDRGFFGIGAEYSRRDEVLNGDRDFFRGCNTHYEFDQAGNIYRDDVATAARNEQISVNELGTRITSLVQPCKLERITGRIFVNNTFGGSLYIDDQDRGLGLGFPGNYYIPFLSETNDALGVPVDADGDGFQDVDLATRTINGNDPNQSFISPQSLYNVMAYGEYNLGTDLNITPFFEALYSRAEVTVANSGAPQFFPWVPSTNAFNPCNFISNPNGVDCRAGENAYFTNTYGFGPVNSTGFRLPVQPIPSIIGDRNNVESVQEQYRGVFGVRLDLPFIGDSWSYEASVVYSRSEGTSLRRGIREDFLAHALGIDPTADFNGDGIVDNNGNGVADDYISRTVSPMLADGPCGTAFANPQLLAPGIGQGCVPVNLFATSLYLPGPAGDFATQAERDYLFGERTFDTTYEQVVASAFITGDLFELPAGPLSVVLGGEYRVDSLDSQPGLVASDGLFWGFFADQGAQGSKYILESFAEINIPVFESDTFGTFDLKAAGRVSDEEFYGTNATYSLGAGWQPIPQVLLRMTYGTSFRAPNLRENFLAGQSGFGGIFDPCAVPAAAYTSPSLPGGTGYRPGDDTREPFVLANCRREGRDPTTVGIDSSGINTFQTSSTEITSGGSLDLDPETSESLTAGISINERFGDFDLSFGFNYFNIEVSGAIIEPTGQSVVNGCFLSENAERSNLCDFIGYDGDPSGRRLVNEVFAGFINVNQETVRGIDLNANLAYELALGNETLDLSVNLRANHLIRRETIFLDDAGNEDSFEAAGTFGFPAWTGRATFAAAYSDFVLTWSTRWIGATSAFNATDPFVDVWGYNEAGEFTGVFSDTCLGAGSRDAAGNLDGIVAGDGNYCADVDFADDYFVHTVSLRYDFNDDITLRAGVTNVFNDAPPLIDTSEVFGRSNVAIGNGYDLNGREFFGSINFRF